MIVGGEKITEVAQTLLESIENDTDENRLIEIEEVFVIVAVHYGSNENDHSSGSLFYLCTSGRYHVQQGLIFQAQKAVDFNQSPG